MPIKKPEPTDDCVRPFFSSTRTCKMSARAAVYSFCAAEEGGGKAAWSAAAVAGLAAVVVAGMVVAALAVVVAGAAKTLAQVRLASSKANCEYFMHPSSVSRSEARAGRPWMIQD